MSSGHGDYGDVFNNVMAQTSAIEVVEEEVENEDNGFLHDYPAKKLTLEAISELFLSSSLNDLDKEERLQLIYNLFEGLKNLREKKRKDALHLNSQQKHVGKILTSTSVNAPFHGRHRDGEVENVQTILSSFLNKAMAKGALELKDLQTVLQCFQETERESKLQHMRGKAHDSPLTVEESSGANGGVSELQETDMANKMHQNKGQVHAFSRSKEGCFGDNGFPRKSLNDGEGSMHGETRQGPVVNRQPVITLTTVSKNAASPRHKASALSGCQGEKDNHVTLGSNGLPLVDSPHGYLLFKPEEQGVRETFHVSQNLPPVQTLSSFVSDFQSRKREGIYNSLKAKGKEKENIVSVHSLEGNNGRIDQVIQGERNHQPRTHHKRSFADVVSSSGFPVLNDNELQKLCPEMGEDEGSMVRVPHDTLVRRMELCKLSIIGRVVLPKGEKAWATRKLRERLNEVWNFKSSWRLISLGKGYFHILLTSQEEFEKVWMRGVINIKPGVLRLQKWSFGFDPLKEKTTNAQVWFRFYNLPWCLWDSSILADLSRKIGTPIRFDNNTINGDFGHYARVLIDVDLSKNIKSVLHLDCGTEVLEINAVPEFLPSFCISCSNIGHQASMCRLNSKKTFTVQALHECSNAKAELAIKDRVEAQRNRRKGPFRGTSTTFQDGKDKSIAGGSRKSRIIEETVTDFKAQESLNDLRNQDTSYIPLSNQFSALAENDVSGERKDNNTTHNSNFEDVICKEKVQVSLVNTNRNKPAHLGSIKEIRRWVESNYVEDVRITNQHLENSDQLEDSMDFHRHIESLVPKVPKKWSDILDEEEEDSAPLFLDMDFPDIKNKSKQYHPYSSPEINSTTSSPEELQGNQIIGGTIITPITSKKNKKLKLGFRQPVGPICTSKR